RAAQLLVEEERECGPEDDLDGDRGEREDERVLDGRPELVAREELAVVAHPDPRPRAVLRVVVHERSDEARDQRVDRERDQIEDTGSQEQQGLAAPLGRWAGPATPEDYRVVGSRSHGERLGEAAT